MLPAEFSTRFPRLFHMAEAAAWPLIQRHGLLSTQALLDLFEVQGEARERIERRQRPDFMAIEHPEHGRALVRDQHPMSDATLAPVLQDNLAPADWYAILNARVFFWVEEARLEKLLGAYRHRQNIVLVLDTARVVADFAEKITLSPINSGFSLRYAQPRGWARSSVWRISTNGKPTLKANARVLRSRNAPSITPCQTWKNICSKNVGEGEPCPTFHCRSSHQPQSRVRGIHLNCCEDA